MSSHRRLLLVTTIGGAVGLFLYAKVHLPEPFTLARIAYHVAGGFLAGLTFWGAFAFWHSR